MIFACATGLRTTARCSIPGRTMLSVQVVFPVISRASSLRRRALPISFSGATAVVGSSTRVMTAPPASGAGVVPPLISAAACCTARTMFW